MISVKDKLIAKNEAYSKAGHNAYFGNGFDAGVKFAEQHYQSEKAELVEMVKLLVDRLEENGFEKFSAVKRAKELIKKDTE